MTELIISFCLLVFVTVRIVNIRRQRRFGVYAFPSCKSDKTFKIIYPGYIGGNSHDRRKIKRKGWKVVPYGG